MGVFAYIKNGTKYKMNQFPGAYPASRVSYNGSDVETVLNADIPQLVGSVVGNGVKTYNQLLGELYTAYVSSGKTFKANSYLELQNGNYVATTGNGSFISFYVNNAQMSTSQIYIGSSPTFYMMTCTTGGNTISDIGSTVASSGYTIKLYV